MLRAFLVSLCLLVSLQAASTPRPLADVSVPTSDGTKIRLSQYKGKVMVIALISTTCDHCATSLILLRNLQKEYGPRGFQILAVAGNDGAAKTLGNVSGLQLGFPVGYLDQNTTMQVFDFKRDDHPYVPMYIFVDKKGAVRFQYAAQDDFFKAEEKNTRILIEGLLKN